MTQEEKPTEPLVFTVDTVPIGIIDLVAKRAGRQHSPYGSVNQTIAEVLNLYEQLRPRLLPQTEKETS